MFQVPGALLWCQWWKNGVAMTRSSGPRRSLVLQWVEQPLHPLQREVRRHGRNGEAEHQDRQRRRRPGEDRVDRMTSARRQPVQLTRNEWWTRWNRHSIGIS